MKNKVRIVTSTNEDETYLDFWELQYKSNKIFFPEYQLTIAFLTNRNYDDELIKRMINQGIDVRIYKPIEGIPSPNLSKILRYICASEFDDDICVITDMDTIPLQTKYLSNIISKIELDKLLCVGKEVLINTVDSGKFPAHHTSGTGKIFKKLYNPENLDYENCVEQISKINNIFHSRECIKNLPVDFSDESLNRALIKLNKIPIKDITRDLDPMIDWIDRSWWSINQNKLDLGQYIESNLLRPYKKYESMIKPIENYLLKCQNKL